MSRFEYLSVLISIVIALGMSEVTISWGRLIQNRKRVQFSWLHAFWSAFFVILMVQFWWAFWNFRTVEYWSFAALFGVVLAAVTLVICALLLTPGRSYAENIDLECLYYEQARPLFLLGAYLLVQLVLNDTLIFKMPFLHTENLIRFLGAAFALALAWSPSKRLHTAFPIASATLLAIFMFNTFML